MSIPIVEPQTEAEWEKYHHWVRYEAEFEMTEGEYANLLGMYVLGDPDTGLMLSKCEVWGGD